MTKANKIRFEAPPVALARWNPEIRAAKDETALNIYSTIGEYGDGDGKDMSHKRNGRIVEESASKNRGSRSNMPGDRRARGKKK